MDIDNLVHMANRIGEFFQAMPDAEEAGSELVLHLRRFWDPRMRHQLLEHVDAAGADGSADGLLPIVHQALLKHRAELG